MADLFERPIGELIERRFDDDTVRGIVLTDALIGTFTHAHDLLANRCFLYHVIGGGTGHWDVPVGGMGTVSAQLAGGGRPARRRARHRRRGRRRSRPTASGPTVVDGRRADAIARPPGASPTSRPAVLDRLLGEPPPAPAPEGAQVKVNMLLSAAARDCATADVRPERAFAGTFHVNEGYAQLEAGLPAGGGGRDPRRRAVRDLLPLADRPDDPRSRPARRPAPRR